LEAFELLVLSFDVAMWMLDRHNSVIVLAIGKS